MGCTLVWRGADFRLYRAWFGSMQAAEAKAARLGPGCRVIRISVAWGRA
jgi:hypothetical protein